jgi:hypothetical protein
MVAERKANWQEARRLIPGTREVKTCAGKNKAGMPCRSTWGGMKLIEGRYYCTAHTPGKAPAKPPRHVVKEQDNVPIPIALIPRTCRARTFSGARCQEPTPDGLCAAHRALSEKGTGASVAAKAGAKAAETALTTAPAVCGPDSGAQAPLSRFAAIAAGRDRLIAERATQGPKTWAAVLAEGARATEARAERQRQEAEKDVKRGRVTREQTAEQVIAAVADYYGVAVADLKGKRRDYEFTYPRQIAMRLLRQRFTLSLAEIGKLLGGRDHTTCMYGVAKIEREVAAGNPLLLRELAEIAGELRLAGVRA